MSHFDPPAADLDEPPRRGQPLWRAIGIGLLVDIGGTMVLGLLAGVVAGLWMSMSGTPEDEARALLTQADPTTAIGLMLLAPGFLCSFAGGWVGMRLACRPDIGPGIVQAVLSTAFGLLMTTDDEPTSRVVVLSALGFLAVMAGAWAGRARR